MAKTERPHVWQAVPVLPTKAMAAAGEKEKKRGGDVDAIWDAMLAAAPDYHLPPKR